MTIAIVQTGTTTAILQTGTTTAIVITDVVAPIGGGSGGSSKQVGVSLVDKQIRAKKHLLVETELILTSKLVETFETPLRVQSILKALSYSELTTYASPIAYAQSPLTIKSTPLYNSGTRLNLSGQITESQSCEIQITGEKDYSDMNMILDILDLESMAEMADSIDDVSTELQFSFKESVSEVLQAFTHSSSWIGNVRYDPESKVMRILMGGKAFTHCGVEQIDYDKFEGAPSKGEHWWREIKDRFNC